MDEVFLAQERHLVELAELEAIYFELLQTCRLRKGRGPAELGLEMPPAPTVIQNTLWLPWLSGSGTWMISGLFGSGQGGSYTPQGEDGD